MAALMLGLAIMAISTYTKERAARPAYWMLEAALTLILIAAETRAA